MPYNHQEIEAKWQQFWKKEKAWKVKEDKEETAEALYHLVMFPYPSAAGLHVGHVESYTAVDILTRKRRMQGKHVLFPIGYDAFGLPAENFAVKTGVHPSKTTKDCIANYHRQMESLGLSFDWSREISTADPEYYTWTQWLFLQFYKNDLAYRTSAPVNWCPVDQTVLANEQVINGKCDRCKSEVIQKDLDQWFFRITKYADRLLSGLDKVDWPDSIKAMQRNWIGKSEGTEVEFVVENGVIPVFTTRPDTLFGVSYIVLAPEHPMVDLLTTVEFKKDVEAYRAATQKKSALDREEEKAKTGVFIGAYARHPLTDAKVPIWIADYALMSYGTGAVMAVPAHDERDYAFALTYDLPITAVVAAPAGTEAPADLAYTKDGIMVNSGVFNGMTSVQAKQNITDELIAKNRGRRVTNFRVRDWLVSRQRYWGAPIPIIWCEDCGAVPVPEDQLPVLLPEDVDFKPTGESPLARSASFQDVKCPTCGKKARRESDTMDTFVDSSWYYLRYCDPENDKKFAAKSKVDYWCPVDLYVGGAEHAVLHLLYARFFAYALHDLKLISFEEPFLALRNQGIILGTDGEKMSKSKGNVVNPDEIVAQYGADALRLYEMFMGPLEDQKPWDTNGLVGIRRFLEKVWRLQEKLMDAQDDALARALHRTIKSVSEDVDAMKFNTAISHMMTLTNDLTAAGNVPRSIFEILLALLAPFAPHIAEELWEVIGNKPSIFAQPWPTFNPTLIASSSVKIAIQVNGKLRGTMEIAPDLSKEDASAHASAVENVAKFLAGVEVKKVIYVPGRMINFVV